MKKTPRSAPRKSQADQLAEARAQDHASHRRTADVLRRLSLLQELSRIGLDMARHTQAQAHAASRSGDAQALLDAVRALDHITTEVCRTVALEAKMEKALLADPPAPPRRAARRKLALRLAAPGAPDPAAPISPAPPQGRGGRLH